MKFLSKIIEAVIEFFCVKETSKEESEFLKWLNELIKEDVL